MKALKIIVADRGLNGSAEVFLSEEELLAMTNALNEVCNALEVPEFSTRIGLDRNAALQLLREMSDLCDKIAGQGAIKNG
jgi:hypothetical protein